MLSRFRQMVPKMPAGGGPLPALLKAGIGLGLLGWAGYNSFYTVKAGQRAVLFNRIGGIGDRVYAEGLQFNVPWFQIPIIFDIRTRPFEKRFGTGSKDLQMVDVKLRVLYKPDPARLREVYRRLGKDFAFRVLNSIVNEVTKAVVARYNASELLVRRELVSREISDELRKRALDFHILLDDVSVTHIQFSSEYTAAVERKQVAQQDAERAKYIVEKAAQEKRSIIVKAQGEAESGILVGKSIKNDAFLQLRRISAARDVADVLAVSQNRIFLDSDQLLVNVLGQETVIAESNSGNKNKSRR